MNLFKWIFYLCPPSFFFSSFTLILLSLLSLHIFICPPLFSSCSSSQHSLASPPSYCSSFPSPVLSSYFFTSSFLFLPSNSLILPSFLLFISSSSSSPSRLMETAREMIRESLPIKCLEAVILGMYPFHTHTHTHTHTAVGQEVILLSVGEINETCCSNVLTPLPTTSTLSSSYWTMLPGNKPSSEFNPQSLSHT